MQFTPLTPARPWVGRYSRIPGKEPAFHVSATGVITAQWTDHVEDELLTAKIQDSAAATAMVKALNETKSAHTEKPGGSFLINEYGQVICPVAGSRDRYLVGDLQGVPLFVHPVNGGILSLAPPKTTSAGAVWRGPYIGMKFNLSHDDRIYFNHETEDTKTKIWLKAANPELIRALRKVRPGGGISFVVNLHGAVFTKVENNLGNWIPVFVAYINLSNWYPREP